MKIRHIFVSALDINEMLPFVIKKTKNLQDNFKEQDRAKKELDKFICLLEKNLKEDIHYIGMDVIGEKAYERFMFKQSGFFEVMVEAPVAMNAHFPDENRAKSFCRAIKKTLEETLPKSPARDMFIDSIEVKDEHDNSLTLNEWHKLKTIRK